MRRSSFRADEFAKATINDKIIVIVRIEEIACSVGEWFYRVVVARGVVPSGFYDKFGNLWLNEWELSEIKQPSQHEVVRQFPHLYKRHPVLHNPPENKSGNPTEVRCHES
jgi:hypothetical protein